VEELLELGAIESVALDDVLEPFFVADLVAITLSLALEVRLAFR
jgi:hypothetical protein